MDNSDFIEKFYDICRQIGAKIWGVVTGFVTATGEADFDYDFGVAFMIAVIMLFFVGSACWAASVAASRRYSQIPHFLLGLVIPWIYPLVILFALDIKGQKQMRLESERQRAEKEAAEAERQKNIALNMGISGEEEQVEEALFSPEHFTRLMRNEDGSCAGPWKIVFAGTEMQVMKIVEVLPEVVVVEAVDAKGGSFRMRMPYAKMESIEEA